MTEAPQHPIIIRGEQNGEAAKIAAVVEEAFSDQRLRDMMGRLRKSSYFKPELSCVAEQGPERVGYVLYFPVMIQGVGKSYRAVHMSPIAVRQVDGRQGIGERLVRHGIQRAHSLGFEIVLVMGPVQYFSYFGFRRASADGIKANLPVNDEHFMVHYIRPELAGAVPGTVLYPPGVLAG